MKKLLPTLVLIMLACGCTDELTADLDLSSDVPKAYSGYSYLFSHNYTESEIEQMQLEDNQRFERMSEWLEMVNSTECNIEYERVSVRGGFYTCMKCENDTIWRDLRNGYVCGSLQ